MNTRGHELFVKTYRYSRSKRGELTFCVKELNNTAVNLKSHLKSNVFIDVFYLHSVLAL